MTQRFPIRGIIPPLATPLTRETTLDVPALWRLLDHVIGGGVHGVFLLGSTGEGPSLSGAVQRDVINEACAHVNGRVPVLVGITDSNLDESLELAEHSAKCGADAVVAAPPFYFPINQQQLGDWFISLSDASPLPVFLYNMPSHVKVSFDIATVRRLMERPNICGIKDSSAQMLYFNELLQARADRPDFLVLTGPEELLAEGVLIGGDGGVCGGANLVPRLFVDLYEAAVSGDLKQVMTLQNRVMRLSTLLYRVGPAPTGFMTGIKTALELVGLCEANFAPPLGPLPHEQRRMIAQHLADLGVLDAKGAVKRT
jgi:4-hydroxy-tetrahydrodipicolinate synthase